MARPLTAAQVAENRLFLRHLARLGNVRLAAAEAGVAYGTVQYRRSRHPRFALAWDQALAVARARLGAKGPRRPAGKGADPHRTQGGEPVVIRRNDGTLQVRRAQPGKLTRGCEQAFLLALSACCNVKLAAAAAGADHNAFYNRRRRDPAFAREWREALERGYQALDAALIEGFAADAHEHDGWQANDPPPVPQVTAQQALQLLYLHQKEARLLAEPPHLKRRRGETTEMWSFRVAEMSRVRQQRERDVFVIAEAARRDARAAGPAPEPVALPDLDQVTDWSRADPEKGGWGERALFGGWRIEDMRGR
jgi:hypothetical protein